MGWGEPQKPRAVAGSGQPATAAAGIARATELTVLAVASTVTEAVLRQQVRHLKPGPRPATDPLDELRAEVEASPCWPRFVHLAAYGQVPDGLTACGVPPLVSDVVMGWALQSATQIDPEGERRDPTGSEGVGPPS